MSSDTTLIFVSAADHRGSQQMARIVRDLVAANRSASIRIEPVDVETEQDRVTELGITHFPAMVLTIRGVERARLVGVHSKRAILQTFLPELYDDENRSLIELRRQLASPGENYPRRALRRRERVSRAARAAMLADVSLFAGLRRKQLDAVARVTDELVIEEGTVITGEGDAGDQFFVLVDGEAVVRRRGRRMATLGAGDCFGEMSLLDGGPRSATVTASSRCVLLSLDRMAFRTVLHDTPELALALLEVLSARLRDHAPAGTVL